MAEYYSIYVTSGSRQEALDIARTLVEEKLAACVNILPAVSVYRWEDSVEEEEELVMFIKTTAEHSGNVISRVRELHSYDVPCIVALPVDKGNPEYLNWIADSTR